MKKFCSVFGICAILISCSQFPYRISNKIYKKQARAFAKVLKNNNLNDKAEFVVPEKWVGTTNFNMRKPNFVIIHHTAQNSCEQTLQTFTKPKTQVSAHYVICKDGTVHHMLNDYLRAWHAGTSKWGNLSDINSSSIGIELDNDGFEAFSEAQMAALEKLLQKLKENYKIPKANFIGHADIAPTRKNDPNVNFDWKKLSDKGFGIWYGDTSQVILPQDFKPVLALKMIGYDTKDTTAAIMTFKRKFLSKENQKELLVDDLKVLYQVWVEALNK
jgi:N-acetylmuramoyl-L-alanine amidase